MTMLLKPAKLCPGDKIATVSLSWGGAGDSKLRWRYEIGKKRIQTLLGLKVVEMPRTLAGSEFIYKNPRARAEDLMAAFADPSIKGIFSCIGGDDSIRLLPYIDYELIRHNPKVFLGYSDTTVSHFICYKAGLSSFYGPAVLSDFAENVALPEYTVKWLKKALFSTEPIGEIPPSETWTSQRLEWLEENKDIARKLRRNTRHKVLQGSGKARGRLIGGCFDVFDLWIRGTTLFPPIDDFTGAILFLETSEDMPLPANLRYSLRSLGAIGVLERIGGLIFAKPYHNRYFEKYQTEITSVLNEYGREDLPVLYNLSFGHCEPKFTIPYGAMAEIDCDTARFRILESGVADWPSIRLSFTGYDTCK